MGIYGTTAGVQGPDQACSEGGAGTTVPPKPPLEPEACSNLSNSKLTYIYSDFLLFLSIDNVTISPFYDYFSNSFLYLNLIYFTFFRGISFK